MHNKIVVGAGVNCYINHVLLGVVTGVQFSLMSQRDEERGVDSLEAFELSPTTTSVSAMLSIFRIRDSDGIEGFGAVSPLSGISTDQYFELELKDRLSGSTYFRARNCAVDGQTWALMARGVMTGQFSFHGLTGQTSFRG